MERITRFNLLFDYYGDLLTKRQKDIFELYYLNDLSLGEIAENKGITRQGVYDVLRRSQKILLNFEDKLCMVKKYTHRKTEIKKILKILKEFEQDISFERKQKYLDVYDRIYSLL